MDNFNFKTWQQYKTEEQPNEGFNVNGDYNDPLSETETRNQLQSLHSQTKKFINDVMVPALNNFQGMNIEGDDTISVTKDGNTYYIRLVETPSGVRKEYVDDQDLVTLNSAKTYTDTKDVSTLQTAKNYTDDEVAPVESTVATHTLQLGGYTLWSGSQAQYDAITTKDANTLYFIEE